MKKQNLLLFVFLLSAFVIACKEENPDDKKDDDTNTKPKSELISQKKWKISNLVSSGTDIWNTPFVESCNKDNQYWFRSDDSLTLYDMLSKCSPTDPDSTVSYYKLFNNNTQLILNVKLTSTATLNDTAKIITLDENTLKLDAEYSGLPATITFTHP